MFHGKIHYKWWFSIAMLIYQRVSSMVMKTHCYVKLTGSGAAIFSQSDLLVNEGQSAGASLSQHAMGRRRRRDRPWYSTNKQWAYLHGLEDDISWFILISEHFRYILDVRMGDFSITRWASLRTIAIPRHTRKRVCGAHVHQQLANLPNMVLRFQCWQQTLAVLQYMSVSVFDIPNQYDILHSMCIY